VLIARGVAASTAGFAPSAVTIGNFDGVHRGHRVLIHKVIAEAHAHGLAPAVLTFDPHPAVIVAPARAPKLLTTIEQRLALMRELGITQTLVLPFTQETAHLTAEQFVERIVVGALKARVVVVGDNFRFGHKQGGDTAVLTALGARLGYRTHAVTAVEFRGRVISSSEVRRAIDAGHAGQAWRLLDRPYAVEGEVVSGAGIGSKQTVPTLNLSTDAEVLPQVGVYITRTQDLAGEARWNSISNIGHRPTFGGGELSIETYLFGEMQRTPERIRVEFLRRVREERKFESPEALRAQILKDVARAQAYFRRLDRWRGHSCLQRRDSSRRPS
jgi:riboflavin kinase/FMN adenylyltransferase